MPSIGFSLDFLNKFSLSDIETWENFSLSDIEMKSFGLDGFYGLPFGLDPLAFILWFGFKFWGFGFPLWIFGRFRIWFSILGFWPFFRVSLDPVERCIPVSGTRIGRHFKIHKKTRKK